MIGNYRPLSGTGFYFLGLQLYLQDTLVTPVCEGRRRIKSDKAGSGFVGVLSNSKRSKTGCPQITQKDGRG